MEFRDNARIDNANIRYGGGGGGSHVDRPIELDDADRAEDLVEEHIRSAWHRLAPSFDRRWGTSEDSRPGTQI